MSSKISESLKLAYKEGRRQPLCLTGELNGFYGKVHSEETLDKISSSLKGKIPWNKGKSGIMPVPWNKGKKLKPAWNKGKKLPEQSGSKHHGWIKDRSLVKIDTNNERGSPLHKQWSRSVKNLDSWKCRVSNKECSGRLVAHHILTWKAHPELRYEVNNGITLCHFHHPRKRLDEIRLAPLFQELVKTRVNNFGSSIINPIGII